MSDSLPRLTDAEAAAGIQNGQMLGFSGFTSAGAAKAVPLAVAGGGGKINTIVPLVSHTDHNKHSVQVIITEQGIADLRGKSPGEWVRLIIENCAHADYRGLLRDCAALAGSSHSPHRLGASFSLHLAFASEGDMRAARYASA